MRRNGVVVSDGGREMEGWGSIPISSSFFSVSKNSGLKYEPQFVVISSNFIFAHFIVIRMALRAKLRYVLSSTKASCAMEMRKTGQLSYELVT